MRRNNFLRRFFVVQLALLAIVFIFYINNGLAQLTEDFDAFTTGQTVGNSTEWFDNSNGPVIGASNGISSSQGLNAGAAIFIWTEHGFDWNDPDFVSVIIQMDFQTDESGHFDDDRIGWMITDDDVESSNIFGFQLDPGGDGASGYNIEGYWDGVTADNKRPSIVNLPILPADTWYRFGVEVTKLTATSASIDVWLLELDSNGDPVATTVTGSIPDTDDLDISPLDDVPNAKYFTATTIWPAYKNYTAGGAPADNAYFEVVDTPSIYETGDVIISGFQAWNSPDTQNPGEFIELFNTTDATISLVDLEIISRTDNNSDGDVEIDWELSADLTGKSIAPYSFFLIAESGVAAPSDLHDLEVDMNLATGEGGSAERAISIQLIVDGVHMDYVVYGRHDGSTPAGEIPPGDVTFGGTYPRFEVIRNTQGSASYQEGLIRRETAADLYAGYDALGYFTDENVLGDGYPIGIWTSPHDHTDGSYEARNSLSPAVVLTTEPPDAPTSLNAIAVSFNTIELNWTDNSDNESNFEIERSTDGIGGPYSFLTTVPVNSTNYTDNGLSPESEYCYQVRATNNVDDSDYTNADCAMTLEMPTGESVVFAAFGDFGLAGSNELAVANLVDGFTPDFIVTTGDNSYGSASPVPPAVSTIDYNIGQYYFEYIGDYIGGYGDESGDGSTINRFFPSIGNHDYTDGGGISAYLSYFTLPGTGIASTNTSGNERYYDFIQGPVHFFAINSYETAEPGGGDGVTSTSIQAQWLEDQLAASTSPWKIIILHHPPYSSSTSHGSTAYMQWPFEEWGATAVFAGHDHVYERIIRDDNGDDKDFAYFTTGAGGKSLYGFPSNPDDFVDGSEAHISEYGSMIVYASYSNITFEYWTVAGGGTLFDTYSISMPSNLSCESFDAFASGSTVGVSSEWYDGGNGPLVTANGGVDNSQGLDSASAIFTWIDNPFDWNAVDFQAVNLKMDFQTDENGEFDDDRVGWMINNASVDSDSIFGVQLDNKEGHLRMEGYWDNTPGDDAGRVEMADLDIVSFTANSWYRLSANITKLGATSAQLDAELWSLDANGAPVSMVASGSIPNTDLVGTGITPHAGYFTATEMFPAYKNHTGTTGSADNACYEINPSGVSVPNIMVSGTPLDPFSSVPGVPSAEQSYTVSGSNLVSDITITAPVDFEVSTSSGSGFGSSVVLSPSVGVVSSTPIYVRFYRATGGSSAGSIAHTSSGATQKNVAVEGEASNALIFQYGLNGYTGTVDTYIFEGDPTNSFGTLDYVTWDGDDPSGGEVTAQHGLIRFDDLFGPGANQIPVGSVIQSAKLEYLVDDVGDEADVHEVLIDWTGSTSWNSFGASAGPISGTDYNNTVVVTTTGSDATGWKEIDVTASLAAWALNPTQNLGWIFNPTGNSGVEFWSSEYVTATERPKLTIEYGESSLGVNWVAFNDMNETTGDNNETYVTKHDYDASDAALIDSITGSTLTATVSGSYNNYDPHEVNGGPADTGTDAGNIFGIEGSEIVDLQGSIELDATDWYNTMTFDNLDPTMEYDIILTSNRDNIEYADARYAKVTIEGADSYTNASSSGVVVNSESSVSFGIGYNTENGYFARWSNVSPGSDGSFSVKSEWDDGLGSGENNTKGYAMWAFRLAEIGETSTTPPLAPTDLIATASLPGQIDLEWTDNSDNETNFIIERSTSGSGGPFSFLISVPANTIFYSDMDLDPVSEYCYRVRATNAAGSSGYSNTDCETTTTSGTVTASFQEGANGYTGTIDTYILEDAASTGHGDMESVEWDTDDPSGTGQYKYGLLRFEEIFGAGVGQIPVGANILNATLTYVVFNQGDYASVNEVAVDWTESVTWNGFGGSAGVQAGDYGDAVEDADGIVATLTIDVTSSLEAWSADPLANRGWIFRPTGTDGVDFRSKEYITVNDRPKLSVTYLSGPNDSPDLPTLVSPLNEEIDVSMNPELSVNVTDPDSDPMNVTFYGREVVEEGTTAESFTVIPIPDTQKYSASSNGGSPAIFDSQTQWIVDNADLMNIVFVTHEGDIVDHDEIIAEWDAADAAMSLLESVELPDGIPYSVCPGNHDTPTTNYNSYFGYTRFDGRAYYGGHYGSGNDNNYCLFSASGMDFIVLSLEYSPSSTVLTWADGILSSYSNRRAIVVSHSILNTGENPSFTSAGQNIYDALKGNTNIFVMLCGHMHGEGVRTDTFDDNTIYTILADYQDLPSGGSGWLRIMEFVPEDNEINISTYSPWLDQYGTGTTFGDDTKSETFTIPYDMNGKGPFVNIDTDYGVPSGSDAFITWSNLAPNTTYEWYVEVSDGIATTSSEIWTFTTTYEKVDLDLTVMLEGPYNGTDMNTELDEQLPLEQPFNVEPWFYDGSESVASIPSSDIVDWILIELREAPNADMATNDRILDRQAAFILNDGQVANLEGTPGIEFKTSLSDNLFVIVYHRNHLGVMSATNLLEIGEIYEYDFTTGEEQAYGGLSAQKQLIPGVWGMIGGDSDASGLVELEDKTPGWMVDAGKNGYLNNDNNLDANVDNKDKNDVWLVNMDETSSVPGDPTFVNEHYINTDQGLLDCAGEDDYDFTDSESVSFLFWFNSSTTSSVHRYIFGKSDFYMNVKDDFAKSYWGTANLWNWQDVIDGNWHHVAIVVDRTSNTMSAYWDGSFVQDVDISAIGDLSNDDRFCIGNRHSLYYASAGVDADFDEFVIYSRALTESEINDVMGTSVTGCGDAFNTHSTDIIGYWRMEEATGTTVDDQSTLENNATFVDNPTWGDH